MIHELGEPIKGATHVKLGQVYESWTEGTMIVRIEAWGTIEDGEFTKDTMLRSGELKIHSAEVDDFRDFLRAERGVPDDVADGNWRRDDLAAWFDHVGWDRIF